MSSDIIFSSGNNFGYGNNGNVRNGCYKKGYRGSAFVDNGGNGLDTNPRYTGHQGNIQRDEGG